MPICLKVREPQVQVGLESLGEGAGAERAAWMAGIPSYRCSFPSNPATTSHVTLGRLVLLRKWSG